MTLVNRSLTALLSAFLALGSAGCASDTALGQRVQDAAITARVKTALLGAPDVAGTAINVDTLDGQVLLSGFVDSEMQANRAVDIASRVDGVKRVLDRTAVKTP